MIPADTRKPYDVREVIARIVDGSRVRRVQGPLRRHAGHGLCPHQRLSGRDRRQQRHPLFASRRRRARISSSSAPSAASRWCSCKTSPASWSAANTRTRASPRTAPRWSRRWPAPTCRSSRCSSAARSARELRHVRAGLQPALPVDVAERPHLGDGRRAGGERAGHGPARRHARRRARIGRRRPRRRSRRRSASSTRRKAILTTPPRGCGTTASSTRSTCAGCSALGISAALNAPIEKTRFGVFRM